MASTTTQALGVRVPNEHARRIRAVAQLDNTTVSAVLARIVAAQLATTPSEQEHDDD